MSIVSVIMPCYNAGLYIEQAIKSVLAQTFKDWELLIIDDCSTDHSASIIKRYQEQDSRIRYFETDRPSGSPAIPRNIGIENAKGKYFAFLDSDDVWLPEKLQEQFSFIEKKGYQFVFSNYEKISVTGERANRCVLVKTEASYRDILRSCEIPCLTVLIHKKLFKEVRFRQVVKEDYVAWLEILRLNNVKAYNTGKVHALYREVPLSRSGGIFNRIKNQWYVLRNVEQIHFIFACYLLFCFGIKGFIKYLK